jgi:predicted Zn-dependent protease
MRALTGVLVILAFTLVGVSTLGLAGCSSAKATQAKPRIEASNATPPTLPATSHYIAHMFHNNRPLVWHQKRISIHCPDVALQPLVKNAFTPWAEGLNQVYPLTLAFVSTPVEADILITTAPSLDAKVQWDTSNRRGYTAALTRPATYNAQTGVLDTVTIEVATQNSAGLPQNPETLQRVILHELGHALGLWGHSSNGFDVMSPNFYKGLGQQATSLKLAQNDIETLQALYQQYAVANVPSNTNPTPTSPEATPSSITSLTRQQALMEASPSWQGYWKLARTYRDANQPLQADIAYGKALQLKGADAELYLERTQALQLAGMNTEALALLSPIPNAYLGAGRLTLEKAWLMVKLNRLTEARTLVEQALKQSPTLQNDATTQQVQQYL